VHGQRDDIEALCQGCDFETVHYPNEYLQNYRVSLLVVRESQLYPYHLESAALNDHSRARRTSRQLSIHPGLAGNKGYPANPLCHQHPTGKDRDFQ